MCAKFCDVRKTVSEVIEVLHDNKIPFSLFDFVFDKVIKEAEARTIPYSPKQVQKERTE